MGLDNRGQAIALAISSGLLAFGTAAAVVPDFIDPSIKYQIATIAWIAGVLGFAIKEALGGKPQQ